MTPRHCQKREGFAWSRSNDSRGRIVYRLFWRNESGKLYMVSETFEPNVSRPDIARDLLRLRNNARVMRTALRIAA